MDNSDVCSLKVKTYAQGTARHEGNISIEGQLHLVFLHNQVENENINDDVIC